MNRSDAVIAVSGASSRDSVTRFVPSGGHRLGGRLNRAALERAVMPTSDVPDDLPDRIVRVLNDAGDTVSVGRIQRLLARDGIDVATSAIRETCDELAVDGRLEKEPGPKYAVSETA